MWVQPCKATHRGQALHLRASRRVHVWHGPLASTAGLIRSKWIGSGATIRLLQPHFAEPESSTTPARNLRTLQLSGCGGHTGPTGRPSNRRLHRWQACRIAAAHSVRRVVRHFAGRAFAGARMKPARAGKRRSTCTGAYPAIAPDTSAADQSQKPDEAAPGWT